MISTYKFLMQKTLFKLIRLCGRKWPAVRRELVRFVDEVRTNFRPDADLHGAVAFRSRCVNLWRSGGRGKLAVVLACVALCWCLSALFGPDDDAGRGGFARKGGKASQATKLWSPDGYYEPGPFGVRCYEWAKPANWTTSDGRPVYLTLPLLEKERRAFVYQYGGQQYAFPPAKDTRGRERVCKKIEDDRKRAIGLAEARHWIYKNLEEPMLNRRLSELESESVKMKYQDKMRAVQNDLHDLEMSKVMEMSPAQYRTYKNSDLQQVNPGGPRYVPRGNPDLFRDPVGNPYEIDSAGNKYWIDSNGGRHFEP